uniref:Acetyltransf_18 domain-containing protein n=1 Tax=Elaeophora elaphi TaxID=1147741 RepID=A0A0R3RR81_9BILA
MNETESVCQFLEHVGFPHSLLCDHFLPDNNNLTFPDTKNVVTVTVLDNLETNLPAGVVAFGAMHMYTSNQSQELQAYLMFCKCDLKYATKSVTIKECEQDEHCRNIDKCSQRFMKISGVWNKEIDYSRLPIYSSAFEDRRQQHLLVHVYEQLVNATLKTRNMDVYKNITVDLYDTDLFVGTEKTRQLYRDLMGFIVTDKTRHFQITIEKSNLQAITKQTRNAETTYMELNSESELHFFEYDSVVAFMNRHDYLDFLYHINGVLGILAIEKQRPVGYVLAVNNHILQCYADTPEIACDLIWKLSNKMSDQIPITMFMRECSDWICEGLVNKARQINRIHRFHSRILPSRVKWENVFLMNIGTHIF